MIDMSISDFLEAPIKPKPAPRDNRKGRNKEPRDKRPEGKKSKWPPAQRESKP